MSEARPRSSLKIGVLWDLVIPPSPPWNIQGDVNDAFRLTFDEALENDMFDRPVELIFRQAEGLPTGSVKSVIDAYKELVEEGCLAILGPLVSESVVHVARYANEFGKVPFVSQAGSENTLGEYSFNLGNGSMPDEPPIIASLMAHAGLRRIGVVRETGVIGREYTEHLHRATKIEGISIVAEAPVASTIKDLQSQGARLAKEMAEWRDKADAVVYFGFGFSVGVVNQALKTLDWHPAKYTGTPWECAYCHPEYEQAYRGWIGLDLYDEENTVGQDFLDRFARRYGRRPEYSAPVYGRDAATLIAYGLSYASSLSPEGVKEGMENVRMIPAASGAPGTRLSLGKNTRRAWMGASYMVARELDPANREKTIFRGRIKEPRKW